jgi:hypothetical protein
MTGLKCLTNGYDLLAMTFMAAAMRLVAMTLRLEHLLELLSSNDFVALTDKSF